MTEPKKSGWKIAEGHIIAWMVGFALTAITIAVTFYFNTNHVMAQNTRDIENQGLDIKKIKDDIEKIKTVPVLNQLQIKGIKKEVARIEAHTEKIDEKLDKVVELLIKMDRNGNNPD